MYSLPFARAGVRPVLFFVGSVLLFSFMYLVVLIDLTIFVLCLVIPMLPVTLDCHFRLLFSLTLNSNASRDRLEP